jgi:hypothetical protein
MLVVNSILFRDNVTFQMAISLGFLFISFCLHITFWPFLGMKQRAEIIREEAEANLFLEIKKLEKAARVVKISGKSYYDIIHKQRVQMDIQTQYINSHVFNMYNYNVIEAILVGVSVLINLAGIMFDSPYLEPECDAELDPVTKKPQNCVANRNSSILAYITVSTIVASIVYFLVVFANEIVIVSKHKRMQGRILWHKLRRQHMHEILKMAKEEVHGHRLLKGSSKFHGDHKKKEEEDYKKKKALTKRQLKINLIIPGRRKKTAVAPVVPIQQSQNPGIAKVVPKPRSPGRSGPPRGISGRLPPPPGPYPGPTGPSPKAVPSRGPPRGISGRPPRAAPPPGPYPGPTGPLPKAVPSRGPPRGISGSPPRAAPPPGPRPAPSGPPPLHTKPPRSVQKFARAKAKPQPPGPPPRPPPGVAENHLSRPARPPGKPLSNGGGSSQKSIQDKPLEITPGKSRRRQLKAKFGQIDGRQAHF